MRVVARVRSCRNDEVRREGRAVTDRVDNDLPLRTGSRAGIVFVTSS